MIKKFLLALLFVLITANFSPAQDLNAIVNCAKTVSTSLSPVNNVTVVGSVKQQENIYYLLSVDDPQQPEYPWDMVVSFNQKKCTVPWVNPAGDFISMTQSPVLPSGVVYELARQHIRYLLNNKFKGSKQILFDDVLSRVSNNQLFITPEDYTALKELGFSPSSNIEIVFPKNFN